MPTSDQRVDSTRYQVIPRVLIFAFKNESVLLIKLLPRPGKTTNWTGRFNGPGGHVERGEDLLTAANRELLEETGLSGNLSLCGTIMVDTDKPTGIGLFIFRADSVYGNLSQSYEGIPEWVPLANLDEYPLVEDVRIIIEKIRSLQPVDAPFTGRSAYTEDGKLIVKFA